MVMESAIRSDRPVCAAEEEVRRSGDAVGPTAIVLAQFHQGLTLLQRDIVRQQSALGDFTCFVDRHYAMAAISVGENSCSLVCYGVLFYWRFAMRAALV